MKSAAVLALRSPNQVARDLESDLAAALPLLLTVEGASLVTGFSVSSLYTKVSRNQIPCTHFGTSVMFPTADLVVWIADHMSVDVQTALDNCRARCAAMRGEERA